MVVVEHMVVEHMLVEHMLVGVEDRLERRCILVGVVVVVVDGRGDG